MLWGAAPVPSSARVRELLAPFIDDAQKLGQAVEAVGQFIVSYYATEVGDVELFDGFRAASRKPSWQDGCEELKRRFRITKR